MKLSERMRQSGEYHLEGDLADEVAQLEAEVDALREANARGDYANERLRDDYKGAMSLLAMIIHNNGGELKVQTVMLRGDEEIIRWDDGLDLHFKLRTSDALLEGKDE